MQVLAPAKRGSATRTSAFPGLRRRRDVNGRGLAAADYDNNGTVDVAVNSIGGRLVLLRNSGEHGHWLEVKLATFAPGDGGDGRAPGRPHARRRGARGEQLPLLRGPARSTSGSAARRRVRSLVVRFPGGTADAALERPRRPRRRRASALPLDPQRRSLPTSYLRSTARASRRRRARSRGSGTTRSSPTPRGRTTPPSRRETSSTSPPRCGTRGPRTRRRRRATSSPRSIAPPTSLAARNAAISYAAYRLLLWRASYGANMAQAFAHLTDTMRSLCYEPDFTSTEGDSPAALGNRIAAAAIAYGQDRRLAREPALPRPELRARERAPGRLPAGRADARPHVLAAARARPDRRPGRAADPRERAVLRRLAVGSRPRLRAARLAEGPADRSRSARRSATRAAPRTSARRSTSSARAQPAAQRRGDALARRAGRPGALERDRRHGRRTRRSAELGRTPRASRPT